MSIDVVTLTGRVWFDPPWLHPQSAKVHPNSRCVVVRAFFPACSSMTKEILHSEDPWQWRSDSRFCDPRVECFSGIPGVPRMFSQQDGDIAIRIDVMCSPCDAQVCANSLPALPRYACIQGWKREADIVFSRTTAKSAARSRSEPSVARLIETVPKWAILRPYRAR